MSNDAQLGNPPAFPVVFPNKEYHFPGMTLRDWFAGQALAGRNVSRSYENWDDMAMDCYEVADAMIAAREART